MKRVIILISLFVLITSQLLSQTIRGKVVSEGAPIPDVVVTDGFNFTLTSKKGEYSLDISERAKFVYISIPRGYMAPIENSVVQFFKPLQSDIKRYNFELSKKKEDDLNHAFFAIADPQIYSKSQFDLYRASVEDIKNSLKDISRPTHALVAGDLISHDHSLYEEYNNITSTIGIPFFSAPGNHDLVVNGRSNYNSTYKYSNIFGPDYYSFNIGNIHYVVLNDCFYIGRDYFYIGYLTEDQLSWLERDLSYVPKGSTVVVTMHIPTTLNEEDRKTFRYDRAGLTLANKKALYSILEPYNSHIISGHTHINNNQIISNSLFEHNTAALCGAWWQGDLCTDGTPKGYGVYMVNGDSLSWYYKSTGYSKDYQLRVYTSKEDNSYDGYIVANIWNYDPSWIVELYENGVFSGTMERFSSYDADAKRTYSDRSKLEHKWIYPSITDNLFRAKDNGSKHIEVRAIDRFGNVYSQKYIRDHYDVIVVGGGTSGVAAGIRASDMGVKTLIIEEYEWLGGMLTSAGVSAVDGNHKLRGGLWSIFRDSLERHYGSAEKLNTGWVSNTLFEPSIGARIFKNIVEKKTNLDVWFRSRVDDISKEGDMWVLSVEVNGNIRDVTANVVIDATELGDIAAKVGVPYDLGMDSKYITGEYIAPDQENDIVQDLTYAMILKEYDGDMTIKKPDSYNPTLFYCSTISEKCVNPKEQKRRWSPHMMITYGKLPNNKYMINWPIEGNDYYLNIVELNPQERLKELKRAKEHSLSFLYYIQTELGFNNLSLADDEFPTEDKFPFIPYHRESRRIHGLTRFTLNHISDPYNQDQKLYRTAIGVGDYPVDHHHARYEGWENLPDLYFYPVPSYGVPMGTLLPQNIDNLIVAEKSISVTNLVNGTTRLQPVVLQIGEAAGIIASLAVKMRVSTKEVPVREVQKRVLDFSGYLLPYLDLKVDHTHFKALQRVGVTGIIKGEGLNVGWENQTWFYADSLISNSSLLEGLNDFYNLQTLDLKEISGIIDLNSNVTAESLLKIISIIQNKYPYLYYVDNIEKIWESAHLSNFNIKRALSRLECAVLIDVLINPFDSVDIDIYGAIK